MAFMKASHLKSNVESLDLLAASSQNEIRRRAAREIAVIQSLTRTEWAPLELDLVFSDIVLDVIGAEETRALNARALARSAEGGLLRPMRDAARRLLGQHPGAIFRFVEYGWRTVFKDVGSAAFVGDADHAGGVITLVDQPMFALRRPVWPIGVAGAFDGVAEIMGASARFEAAVDEAQRSIRFVARWQESVPPGKSAVGGTAG